MTQTKDCIAGDYIQKFLDTQTYIYRKGVTTNSNEITHVQQQGKVYNFNHARWDGPIVLDLTNLEVCNRDDSSWGNLLVLYVMGKLNENMNTTLNTSQIAHINGLIIGKIDVINKAIQNNRNRSKV
jgi:hypothetical protein